MKQRIALSCLALAAAFVLGVGTAAFTAERHHEIRLAMRSVQRAVRHLEAAPNEYGGHPARALELVQAAAQELEQAMAFAEGPQKK